MMIAFFIAIIILFFNWKFFEGFAYIIYFITILSLIGVLLFGAEVNGAKSWFDFGFLKVQPAEFAKCATCLVLAKFLSTLNIKMSSLKTRLIVTGLILTPILFIILQNDTGSALVYVSFLIVLYRFGLPANVLIFSIVTALIFIASIIISKVIVISMLVLIAILFFLISKRGIKEFVIISFALLLSIGFNSSVDYVFEKVLEPHQVTRIMILLGQESDPQGAGYNVNQSKIAIGSGGLAGKGFLKGTQSYLEFLPEKHTDFIFTLFAEEHGFLGSLGLLLIYIIIIYRVLRIGAISRSYFAKLFCYGYGSAIFFYVTVNMSMVLGLLPIVGSPLPIMSYGGSSMLATMIGFAIVMSAKINHKQLIA